MRCDGYWKRFPQSTRPPCLTTIAPLGYAEEAPTCENGIPGVQGHSEDGVACCALSCKNEEGHLQCGGERCGFRDKEGGRSSCCIQQIVQHGPSCDAKGATSPCSICEGAVGIAS